MKNEMKYGAALLSAMTDLTAEFARDVIALPIPDMPQRLDPLRKDWSHTALEEELQEFKDAETLEDEVDALVDMTYFACGRLVEMGVFPRAVFEEVHAANMRKVQGELSKRPNSLGHDAIKPEGWTGPNHTPYLRVGKGFVDAALEMGMTFRKKPPRIIVMGHGRHGKDTVCELLRESHDLRFTSSSLFCAQTVIPEAVETAWQEHYDAELEEGKGQTLPQGIPHVQWDAETHFANRHDHRAFWFEAIAAFNEPDPTRLARAIFEENDVYCGLRRQEELNAIKSSEDFEDVVTVWVDASDRLPPEDESSCTVGPCMCDYKIDNNGSLGGLTTQVEELMNVLMEDDQ